MSKESHCPVKGLRRSKRCVNCRDLFDADRRTKGGQKYCGKQECQKVRQRKNEKDWRKRHSEKQLIWGRLWNRSHSDYSAKRRSANPELLQSNRELTRVRMQKRRAERMFDKSKLIVWQLTGNKADKCYLARGGRWMFLRLTKASPFTRGNFMWHNRERISRVSNSLPKGKIYELSEKKRDQSRSGP